MGCEFDDFPDDVKQGKQNISIKISPVIDIELITSFNPGRNFEECYRYRETVTRQLWSEGEIFTYDVISFEDLISSKIKAGRPKDLYDIMELKRIRGECNN